jgi:hypothetical protein
MSADALNVHAILNAPGVPASCPKALAIARAFGRIRERGKRACPSNRWVVEQRG